MRLPVRKNTGRGNGNRDLGIFIVSAYAPTLGHGLHAYDDFLQVLDSCIKQKHKGDMPVICGDFNASCAAVNSREGTNTQGPFGKHKGSKAGLRFSQ